MEPLYSQKYSSKIDSGFELLDYDLQLFVYTTSQNPMADLGTDIINDNDIKENHTEKIKEINGKAEGFAIHKNKREDDD
ncbi:MAG: hypothetical protein K2K21_09620 [Lachnospiraceae bacterium]|nr:hypothetical protein [Lachnospiraceae bacterium]